MKRIFACFLIFAAMLAACGAAESPEVLFAEVIGDAAEVSFAYETVDGTALCDVTVTLPLREISHDVLAGKADTIDGTTARGNTRSYVLRIAAVPTVHYIYAKTPDGWVHVYTTGMADVTEAHDWYIVRSENGSPVPSGGTSEASAALMPEGYDERLQLAADAYRSGKYPAVHPAGQYTAQAVYEGETVGALTLDIPCPADVSALKKHL